MDEVIAGVSANPVYSTSATIGRTTNEPADSLAEYGLDQTYGLSMLSDSALVTSHSVILNGLSPSTTYHYRVMSTDFFGNAATSNDLAFTSTSFDVTPPLVAVTNPAAGATVSRTVTLTAVAQDAAGEYGDEHRVAVVVANIRPVAFRQGTGTPADESSRTITQAMANPVATGSLIVVAVSLGAHDHL